MSIIGQEHILNYLKKSIEKDKISHAYLFAGPEKSGKKEMALWFVKRLGCQYPDITRISVSKEKEEISIDQIRELRRYLSLSSHSSPYKVAIIDGAEKMKAQAANALLKTLEEPKGNTVLILLTNILSTLPDTIISRCEEIRFRAPSLDKVSKDFIKKEYIDILKKPLNDKFEYIEKICKPARGGGNKTEIFNLLDNWLFWFREQIIKAKSQPGSKSPENFIKILKEIQRTKNLVLNTNVNKRLALENLALCIKN